MFPKRARKIPENSHLRIPTNPLRSLPRSSNPPNINVSSLSRANLENKKKIVLLLEGYSHEGGIHTLL